MAEPKPSEILPYLRSATKECEKPIDGEVKGEVPKWLKGGLVRVGSGLLQIGPDKYNHVFDGMAMMHRFNFQNGSITYQNRFLRSDAYRDNMRANRIVVSEFGTRGVPDPCKTIFQRFVTLFSIDMTDNDLVSIVQYGNEAFACSETNNIWKINPETLESIEKINLHKYVPVNAAIAHPHEDSTNGTMYNIGTKFFSTHAHYNIVKFPPKEDKNSNPFEKGSVVCTIPASKKLSPSYYHSFGITENYFVFIEQPLYMSIPKMAYAHFIAGSYSQAMSWDSETQSRFHVVRRSDGKLLDTSYLSAPFFVFHHVNAYEEDNQIVVDICAYDKGDIVNALYVKALEEMFVNPKKYQEPFMSRARRFVLPLNVDKNQTEKDKNLVTLKNTEATATLDADGNVIVKFEQLTKEPWSPELPRIHYEKYNGKKYRYFYAMARKEVLTTTHLVKVDTETKTTLHWSEEGAIPSEPVFVAEPGVQNPEEDSGVILASLLYTDDESKVSLLVLDAKTMKERGRATFKAGSTVPGDFHGLFIPKN